MRQNKLNLKIAVDGQVAGDGAAPNGEDEPPARRISARLPSQAPRPPHQVSGKGTVSKDAAEDAIEHGDSEAYMRAMNAKVLAERARK